MTTTERKKLAELVGLLGEAYRQKITGATIKAYEIALDGLPIDRIERAAVQLMRSQKFMPTASELYQLARTGMPAAARIDKAWQVLNRAIDSCGYTKSPCFDDPLINATIRSLGGWEYVCAKPLDEFHKWFRKDFEKTYATFLECPPSREACQRLIGAVERENRIDYPKHTPEPAMIGCELPAIPGVELPTLENDMRPKGIPRIEFSKP